MSAFLRLAPIAAGLVLVMSAACEELVYRTSFGRACVTRADCNLDQDDVCLDGACAPGVPLLITVPNDPLVAFRGRTLDVEVPFTASPGRTLQVIRIQPAEVQVTLERGVVHLVWAVPAADNGPIEEFISVEVQDADTGRGVAGFGFTVRTLQPPGGPCSTDDTCLGRCEQGGGLRGYCTPDDVPPAGCAADEVGVVVCDAVPCRQACLARRLFSLSPPGEACAVDAACHFGRCEGGVCAQGRGHGGIVVAGTPQSCAPPLVPALFEDDTVGTLRCVAPCGAGAGVGAGPACPGPGGVVDGDRCLGTFCDLRRCDDASDCEGLGGCEVDGAGAGRCVDGSSRVGPGALCGRDSHCEPPGRCVDGGVSSADVCSPAPRSDCGDDETAALWCDGAATTAECLQTCLALLQDGSRAEGASCSSSFECRLRGCSATAPPTCVASAGPWALVSEAEPLVGPGCAPPLVPFAFSDGRRCVDPCEVDGPAGGCGAQACLPTTRVVVDTISSICAPIACPDGSCPAGMTCRAVAAIEANDVPGLPSSFCVGP